VTTDTVTSLHPTWCTLAPADDVTAAGRLRLQLQPAARRATLVPDEPGCIDAGACRCGHCTPPSTTLCLPVTPAPRPIPNSNPDLRTAAGMGWFGNEFAGAVRHALNWGVLRACQRSSRRKRMMQERGNTIASSHDGFVQRPHEARNFRGRNNRRREQNVSSAKPRRLSLAPHVGRFHASNDPLTDRRQFRRCRPGTCADVHA